MRVGGASRDFSTALVLLCPTLVVLVAPAARTLAQGTRDVRLSVTVVDQTNLVLPAATVRITGEEDATRAKTPEPTQTTTQGIATFTGLVAGRYTIQAEFPGFDTGELKGVRVRAGDNRQTLVLKIQHLQDSITVGQDAQDAASDRRGPAFGTALTREQIDALSDDPDEMKKQIQDLAGPDAVIRVDSFEGSDLPPKSQIKSIHVTRDGFAAENHYAGAFFVDIITQPGLGQLRGGFQTRLRSGALSGRSPFTPTKGPEQIQGYNMSFGGPIRSERSSFSIQANGTMSYETPNLNVALPNQDRSEALAQRTHHDNGGVNALFDYAITRDQTLRLAFSTNRSKNSNLGIGAYDLPERAFGTHDRNTSLRIQEAGPIGRRFFINTRAQLQWSESDTESALEAPTIRVVDAFTSGGAQSAGGRVNHTANIQSDLDYVRGIHSVRAGIVLDIGQHHSDATSNYLGTYTFASREDYEAGRPLSYTRRIGDPTIDYFHSQAGVYIQDDIRVRRTLTFSPGVRYEVQAHLNDFNNFGPRFGVTWAPFKNAKTTFRASAGMFYDWLSTNTYEQSLRVDGFRQRELNIIDPIYPDPGNIGLVPPVNRYLLGPDLHMARNSRISAGVDHAIRPRLRVGALYAYIRGQELLHGVNENAPVDGVRPDPSFANVIEVVSDARSVQHTLTLNANAGAPPGPPPGAGGPLWNFKRISFNGSYTLGSIKNDTDGDFSASATGRLASEWGPTANDVRHRAFVGVNTQALRNFSASLNLNVSSASRYTIRTGTDDNSDGIFNDRPAGVGRNTEHTSAQWTLNGYFTYVIAFGARRPTSGPGGIGIIVQGDRPTVTTFAAPPARFRMQFNVSASNLTNHDNYAGYSGTLTSPFYGQPTLVLNPRKIEFSVGLFF
jgi:carboxypeptidase family protein